MEAHVCTEAFCLTCNDSTFRKISDAATLHYQKELDRRVQMEGQIFETKDSGKREEFSSGMVRDTQEGKIRVDVALDGPLAFEVFNEDHLIGAFNIWYQGGGTGAGALVIKFIAEREGGLIALFERYAGLMTRGAQKYSARNWMKATGEAEFERFKASACRHFLQYIRGDKDEDHAAAVWFNINGCEFVRQKLEI